VAILYRRIFPKIYLNHPSQIASLALLNPSSTPATVHFKAYSNGGSLLVTAQRTLQPNGQLAQLLGEILNTSNSGTGWLLTETTTPNVEGFFLLFDNALTWMDGAGVSDRVYRDFILPIGEGTETSLVNPGNSAVDFNLSYISEAGLNLVTAQGSIPALGRQTVMSDTLRPQGQRGGYLRGTCSGGVVALQVFGNAGWAAMLEATDPAAVPAATGLYAPQFAVGGGYQSTLDLINLENTLNIVTLTLIDDQGRTLGQPASVNLPPRGSARLAGAGAFGLNSSDALVQGYVRLQSSGGGRIAGSVTFTDMEQRQFGSALNFVAGGQTMSYVSQVAQDAQYFTGLAAINPNARPCTVTVTVFDTEGKRVASGITQIAAGGRFSRVLPELVAPFPPMTRGYFQVESTEPLACFSLFGTYNGSVLAAIPPHRGAEK
jgi:hypothetical protein